LALAAALTNAAAITWTGYGGDNQWTNRVNWNPDSVPGPNDDVTINQGTVYCTIATGVNSLVMGTQVAAPANLTLFQSFVIGNGGLTVQQNGNLIINVGTNTVFGQVSIGGNLYFVDGILSGAWTVAPRAFADLGNSNQKGFSGATFTSQGQLSLGGVLTLNQSSSVVLQSATTANKNLFIQNGDGSAVSFDASAAQFTFSTGTLYIQAPVMLGQFTLQSGNITIVDSLTFNNALNVPENSFVAAVGSAAVNFSAGATGAGVVSLACTSASLYGLSMSGYVNVVGGTAIFYSQSDMSALTLDGGNVVFMETVYPTHFTMIGGTTSGSGSVVASNVLISTKGLSLGSAITVNSTLTLQKSVVAFGQTAALTIDAKATATITGATTLTGAPNGPRVTNHGTIEATADLSSQNIPIVGSGSVKVASKLQISQIQFSQASVTLSSGSSFSGLNSFLTIGKIESATKGDVKGQLGDYTFSCQAECDNVSTPNTQPPNTPFTFSA
jgi:hypothetical protein